MKKGIIVIFVIILITSTFIGTTVNGQIADNGTLIQENKLTKDVILTLLQPDIVKAITDYYGEYLTYIPAVDPSNTKILNITRIPGYNYTFSITIQVMPYLGAHNIIGIDNITFYVEFGENVKVDNFKHIKSYQIPPTYNSYVKGWPPE